jgi:hemerythrin-like metal-binding protein
MALIAWDQSYSVGVRRCDEQHRRLFALLNALHSAMSVGKGQSIIMPIVAELQSYTEYHFSTEEVLMQQTKYPSLAAHRDEHQKFVMQVDQFRNNLESGLLINPVNVMQFLRAWLANHIQQTDRAFGPHLNACGIN